MAPQDWIRLGYIAGAFIALVAALLERKRGDRRGMLVALIAAMVLLAVGRTYNGGLRPLDFLTSIASTAAAAVLLANASLRKGKDKTSKP